MMLSGLARVGDRTIGFEAVTEDTLDLIADVDKTAYAHPWSRRHFADSLRGGHTLQMLVMAPDPLRDPPQWTHAPALPDGRWLLGYLVVMPGVDEVHLLNITTVPTHQRQGWARFMLEAMGVWARQQGAHTVWLEVRASNAAARSLYTATGFEAVGLRKGYYPDHDARREDAIVMRWRLDALH